MHTQTTIRKIARECGFHFTTVALALRNSSKVAASTRAEIQRIAQEMGYRPNPLVSALMAQKRALRKPEFSSVLAYVSFDQRSDIVTPSSFESEYLIGAREKAHEMGYQMESFSLFAPGMSSPRLAQIFRTRAISGLLLGASKRSKTHLPPPLHAYPTVALGYSVSRPALHRVAHNHYQGSFQACRHLRRDGYRRIGLVLTTLMDNQMDRLWSAGYLAFHERLPASSRPAPLYLPSNEFPPDILSAWVQREKPDVILTMHRQVKDWLETNRRRFRHRIDIASLDLSPEWGPCCGVWQKPQALGKEAVSFLISQIQNNQHGLPSVPITLMIDGEWLEAVRKVRFRTI